MRIKLERDVKVQAVKLIGEFAFPKERKPELALLEFLRENLDQYGTVSLDTVREGLVQTSPVIAQNLLRACRSNGLIETRGGAVTGLTEKGTTALKERKIYIPERGTFEVFFSEDPLLRHPFLLAHPYQEPSAHEEAPELQILLRNKKVEQAENLPVSLRAQIGEIVEVPAVLHSRRMRIDLLEPKVHRDSAMARVRAILEANPGDDHARLQLRGSIQVSQMDERGKEKRADKEIHADYQINELDHGGIWRQLLAGEQLLDAWDSGKERLLVEFEGLSPGELRSFRKDLNFHRPHLQGFGGFERCTVEQVPIYPKDEPNAEAWHDWLLCDSVSDYVRPADYLDLARKAAAKFPEYRIEPPEQAALAEGFRKENPVLHWHLRAPLDLPA